MAHVHTGQSGFTLLVILLQALLVILLQAQFILFLLLNFPCSCTPPAHPISTAHFPASRHLVFRISNFFIHLYWKRGAARSNRNEEHS